MQHSDSAGSLDRYFTGLTEFVFHARLGVADPPLVDYLSQLLHRFVRSDSLQRIRNSRGKPIVQVVEMLQEAESRVGLARRDVHRHIGDVTLFWIGVYPEAMETLRGTDSKDYFVDYCSQGKRAYQIASTIDTDQENDAPCELLYRLSSQFEMCAYGLGEVRREWEQGDSDERRILLIN